MKMVFNIILFTSSVEAVYKIEQQILREMLESKKEKMKKRRKRLKVMMKKHYRKLENGMTGKMV